MGLVVNEGAGTTIEDSFRAETGDQVSGFVVHAVDEQATFAIDVIAASSGTQASATYTVSGQIGGGMGFDGTDDRLQVSESPSIDFADDDFSISAWFKGSDTGPGMIVSKHNCGSPNGYFVQLNELGNTGALTFHVGGTTLTQNGTYNDDAWHHVVATFDADINDANLYIDGALAQNTTTGEVLNWTPTTPAPATTWVHFSTSRNNGTRLKPNTRRHWKSILNIPCPITIWVFCMPARKTTRPPYRITNVLRNWNRTMRSFFQIEE